MTQVQLNKQFELKGMTSYTVNFVFDPSDTVDIHKFSSSGDTVMKEASGKRQVKKANSWALSKSGKGSDLSTPERSNSTGNSTNGFSSGGMLDSEEKKRERANSNQDGSSYSQVMVDRWLRSNQGIPCID